MDKIVILIELGHFYRCNSIGLINPFLNKACCAHLSTQKEPHSEHLQGILQSALVNSEIRQGKCTPHS